MRNLKQYGSRWTKTVLKLHMDIQLEIYAILEPILAFLTVEHVRGHQDTKSTRRLTWIENLNVCDDFLATQTRYRLNTQTPKILNVYFPSSHIQL